MADFLQRQWRKPGISRSPFLSVEKGTYIESLTNTSLKLPNSFHLYHDSPEKKWFCSRHVHGSVSISKGTL